MDHLARNVDDLRRIVLSETRRGVRMQFIKENLVFTGEDSPMANLMLSVLGAVAQFERDLIKERQREASNWPNKGRLTKREIKYDNGASGTTRPVAMP
jgi:DNA invertase Pin-like site-specific DNA recombinase